MSQTPALSTEHLAMVRAILARHLPAGCRVHAFGSRAGGTAKPWSDLDLALDCPEPLPLATMAALAEAFAESDLPWKVDLVDLATVDAAFRGRIAGHSIALEIAGS